jgi:hypothetical protein
MKFIATLTGALIFLGACTQQSVSHPAHEASAFGQKAEAAPAELLHMGAMIGQWAVTEDAPKQDGSGWEQVSSADWNFYWGMGGWSIYDDYISPPLSTKLDDENKRQRGTNVRVYNVAQKKWYMSWLTTNSTKPEGFTATSDDSKVVMLSDDPYFGGQYVRITFFDMKENSFEWYMELSKDGKEGWSEVYRIHGTRKTQ